MPHFLSLKRGLVNIDGNITGKSAGNIIPKRNNVRRTVDSTKTAIQGLNAFVPGHFYRELHGRADFLRMEDIRRQVLKILSGIRPRRNPS
jgi:hypothetical protein